MMKAAELAASVSRPFTIALTPPKLAVLMFYHVAIFTVLRRYLRFAYVAIIVCSAVLITSIVIQRGWFAASKLQVTFLDVGQGSSVVVRFPDNKVMLVDGGGSQSNAFDIGKFVVAPYLWHEGISRVDWLVNTHAHPDHFKGLGFIAEEFSPAKFIWNGVPPEEAEQSDWAAFMARIDTANTVVQAFRPDALIRANALSYKVGPTKVLSNDNDVFVGFLSPPENIPQDWNMNDTSLVTKIVYGGTSFLLTGDIEAKAEEQLLNDKLVTAYGSRFTVFQVPHHGSSTSTTPEFLEAVRPEYAVIQCGEKNRYGFPNAGVLERLTKVGAKIYRTDVSGAVTFKTDGRTLKVTTF